MRAYPGRRQRGATIGCPGRSDPSSLLSLYLRSDSGRDKLAGRRMRARMGRQRQGSFVEVTPSAGGISISHILSRAILLMPTAKCKVLSEVRGRSNLLGEVVGVEEGLFFLLVERVRGRALKTHGRIIQLGQFSLARQQTVSAPILAKTPSSAGPKGRYQEFSNFAINTYAISSFLDRRSSSRSMRSNLGKQHPINAGIKGAD